MRFLPPPFPLLLITTECLAGLPVSYSSFPLAIASDSPVGKESTCDAGDPVLIPGLEFAKFMEIWQINRKRSAGEGIGCPLQYTWASLVVQLVKNLPAMWGTWVWSLGWEDPLEKGKATHSSLLAWRIPWTV